MRGQKNPQSGFTLMEIMIVVAISTVLMILCYNLVDDAMRTSFFVESHNNLSQWAQRPLNFMQTEVFQNKTVFDGTTVGAAYLTRFSTPPSYPGAWPACTGSAGCGGTAATVPALPAMQANSLLPLTDSSNIMAASAGSHSLRS
jgi:prepilin-type N-terminal cleavage/methylation domain-containing protein